MKPSRYRLVVAGAIALFVFNAQQSLAQKRYDPGASDAEIKIGNTMPYSGPLSSLGLIGRTASAYFRMVDDQGGVNGRKISFISYDDAYSPPKTVEQVRRLVESDEVLLLFATFGTPTNAAVQKYLNAKKIPTLFVGSGATRWDDPKHFPWTMGWNPTYQNEAKVYAKYLIKENPNARIGVIYQNDDSGKDYIKGLKDGLGDKSSMIVVEESYEVGEPTIESRIVKMKTANVDVVVNFATQKFAAQAIKKISELGWRPVHIIGNISASVNAVFRPGGISASQGILTADYRKDAADPKWSHDPGMKKFHAFMDKYMPGMDRSDAMLVAGYAYAQTLVDVLQRCGDDLTRTNVMKQAASIKNFAPDTTLPGILLNTTSTDYAPVKQLQMQRLKGETFEEIGDLIAVDAKTN